MKKQVERQVVEDVTRELMLRHANQAELLLKFEVERILRSNYAANEHSPAGYVQKLAKKMQGTL